MTQLPYSFLHPILDLRFNMLTKIIRLSLTNLGDTSTVQIWLEEHPSIDVKQIQITGYDVYIMYIEQEIPC